MSGVANRTAPIIAIENRSDLHHHDGHVTLTRLVVPQEAILREPVESPLAPAHTEHLR